MPTYIAQVNVKEQQFQNPKELIAAWGTIQEEIETLGGEVLDAHAVLGAYDFHIKFTVKDGETAFQATQIIERHGLDTKTMQALPLERLGELVDDV